MSDRTSNEGGEPRDLLSYIGAQEFTAEDNPDAAVNTSAVESPSEPDQSRVAKNDNQVTPDATAQPGVTTRTAVVDDEKIQLQQQLETERQRSNQMTQALTMFAAEAKKREDALFEQKLEFLTPEEQTQEREARRVTSLEADNQYLRSQMELQSRRQIEAQENIDKTHVAHRLIERLELPGTDPVIMQTLTESQDFPEMVAKAQRIAEVY